MRLLKRVHGVESGCGLPIARDYMQ